ncbi:MAG: formylglycine-generating enzyme family protein [Anaerolineae bacterium]|nr:formylglycine-generating enzyme family protein [Anaerolineae bacterium]
MNLPAETQTVSRPTRLPAPRPTTQMMIGCFAIPLLVAVSLGVVFMMVRANASASLTVPTKQILLVRLAPDETAPLLARFGEGRSLKITGRTSDWRWLEVELWDDQRGWTLRPLDILVWQLRAPETTPTLAEAQVVSVTPVAEEMITIPAATFTMGSPPGIGEDDERPAHLVKLAAFELDRTEVTVGQYWQCVAAGACAAPTADSSADEPHYLNDPVFDNHPVVNVPWLEASHYCAWRGKRLPTEAEWELAAGWDAERGAKLQWPWGNEVAAGPVNVGDTSLGKAAAAGSQVADKSPLGVLDLGGNVSEWVFDWYKVDYYGVADETNPIGPTNRRGEGTGRVVRGGSFVDSLEQARIANRGHQAEEYGYPSVGFRCARDIPQ